MEHVRVMIAAADSCVRLGLRTLLTSKTIDVVGEAAGALDTIAKASTLQPQIVVVDLSFPHANGVATLQEIGVAAAGARIVVLSDKDNEVYVEQALMNGASAYLLKQTATSDLGWAIQAVRKGREYFSPALIQHLRSPAARIPEPDQCEGLVPPAVSPLESHLIAMIHQGVVIRQMARELSANIKAIRHNRPELLARSRPRGNSLSRRWGTFRQLLQGFKRRPMPTT